MATKNTILGTVPKSRGRYTEGDTTTKWYYDNILEYKGSSFRCISTASTGITGAPATYDANAHTLVPNVGWEFFVDTTGTLDVRGRLTENEKKLFELEGRVDDAIGKDKILIFDESNKYNIVFNGTKFVSSSNYYSYIAPLKIGEKLSFVNIVDTNIASVRLYDTAPALEVTATVLKTFNLPLADYTAEQDCWLVISYNKGEIYTGTIRITKDGIVDKVDKNTQDIIVLSEVVDKKADAPGFKKIVAEYPYNYIILDTGKLGNNKDYNCTDYIAVSKGYKIKATGITGATQYPIVMGYSEDKSSYYPIISGLEHKDEEVIIEDDNIKWIVACGRNNNASYVPYLEVVSKDIFATEKYVNDAISQNIPPSKAITIVKKNNIEFYVNIPCNNGKIVKYYFKRDYKEHTSPNVVSAYVWNNYTVLREDESEICQGNTNFICKTNRPGETFVGDGHGNEVMFETIFLADGQPFSIEEMTQPIKCNTFNCMWKSNIYEDGNGKGEVSTALPKLDDSGNPIVLLHHYLNATFEIGNKVTIDNRLTVMQDNLVFDSLFGAMLEMHYTHLKKISINNPDLTINEVNNGVFTPIAGSTIDLSVSQKHKGNYVEMFGDDCYVSQRLTQVDGTLSNKMSLRVQNYVGSRMKVYLMPCECSFSASDFGWIPRTFNTGDTIQVIAERRIELY